MRINFKSSKRGKKESCPSFVDFLLEISNRHALETLSPTELAEHKAALVDFFTTGPGSVCQLDSLFFQESAMTRCTHEESPYQLLHGVPYIYEEILGFKFRISPDAFFQVNQAAAEVLYRTIRDLCAPSHGTGTVGGGTLLDVCCGTGAIGIIASPRLHRVLGVELVEQAVEDARHNSALNNVHNCEFRAGKAEAVLPSLMKDLDNCSGLTAVVNPARGGLHYRVVRALRNHSSIRRLVYVSCKPEGEAMRNFRELCCSPDLKKRLTGEAFTPTLAVPVDMFPHTPHCELVLLFERLLNNPGQSLIRQEDTGTRATSDKPAANEIHAALSINFPIRF
uniref:tRNA (uracil(54)-C(5))-methyltransferase n=1 Tax=Knipowitschia caucasica TaxID=637954 RepID=A0AAV2JQ61_KNICA